ncbi:MAG: hypothetical protein ACI3WU_00550 [Phascolarctobacterium sp.]
MAVKIVVSAEELNKTMEYMSLISGAVPGKSKKDDLNQAAGSMKITAVSPKKDKSYLLIFECVGMSEQLIYRMEGKSYCSTEMASAIVDAKSFMTLVKTFTSDIELVFEDKHLGVNCGTSYYKVTLSSIEIPKLELPKDGQKLTLSVDFLVNANKFCSVACAKNDTRGPVFHCIQINLRPDGSAVCYATNAHKMAKYVYNKAANSCSKSLLLLPGHISHITDICTENELTCIPTDNAIYITTPRFDYMCYVVGGRMPDCEKIYQNHKAVQTIVVDRGKLLTAVSRAMIFSGDKEEQKIKFATDTENIFVNADSVSGGGLDSIPLDKSIGKDDLGHFVSGSSLRGFLACCGSEKVTISISSPLAPIIISIPDTENSYVLTAMR